MGRSGDSPVSPRPLASIGAAERRLVVAIWAAVAVGVVVHWALLALGGAVPPAVLDGWGQTAGCAIGAAALMRPILVARKRLEWSLVGGAVALFTIGDAVWVAIGEPELSAVDGIYLAGLVALHAGLLGLLRPQARRSTGAAVMDALAAALTVVAVGVALLAPPMLEAGGSRGAMVVNLAYPMWDLALLATAFGAVALSGWRPGRDMGCLLAGFAVFVVADTGYVVGVVQGVAGTVEDVLWPLAYVLVGVAGWLPEAAGPRQRPGAVRTLALPAVLGATALGVLVAAGLGHVNAVAVALAAGAVAAVLARGTLLHLEGWALTRDLEAVEARASRDPLTGLLTHRAFRERLAEEVATAIAERRPMALVLLDIDHFGAVNESRGHQAGDEVLRAVAACLAQVARDGDVLGRVGGEEFAWVLPEADDLSAWEAAERARDAVRVLELPGGGGVTVSGGVADLRHARDDGELMRLADGALYWAKAHGRDVVFRYSTGVVRALSAEERARQLMRAQALNAMRVLARAVDARDPYTARHSERVADLCVRLATALGWDSARIVALQEAALVHDVGKIGVPDAILLKEHALTDEERLVIEGHAALGAQIVGDALSAEQASWVRAHHERFDGAGYPDMLAGADIPDGARIMTVADSWDAMTTDRPYRLGLPVDEALGRIVAGRGTHFCPDAVDAMLALHEHGLLDPATATA